MSTTVQSSILQLALEVDARTLAGNAVFTAATIGTTDGQKFVKQRLLDVYNDARMIMFSVMRSTFTPEEFSRRLSPSVLTKTDLTFASGIASIPAGYLAPVSLTDVTKVRIPIVPIGMSQLLVDDQTTGNRFVYERADKFENPSGVSFIANGATYILKYLGITNWSLTDVTAGTALEIIRDEDIPKLTEIAAAVASEQGSQNVLALAKKLLIQA